MNALFSRLGLLAVLLAFLLPVTASAQIMGQIRGGGAAAPIPHDALRPQANNYEWVRIYATPSTASVSSIISGQWQQNHQRTIAHWFPSVGVGLPPSASLSWDIGSIVENGILNTPPPSGTFDGISRGEVTQWANADFTNAQNFQVTRADVAGQGSGTGYGGNFGSLYNHGWIGTVFVEANGRVFNGNADTGVAASAVGKSYSIDRAIVNNFGQLANNVGSTIHRATVNAGGLLTNNQNSQIGELILNSGGFAANNNNARIELATLHGGTINNFDNSTIGLAVVRDGGVVRHGAGQNGTTGGSGGNGGNGGNGGDRYYNWFIGTASGEGGLNGQHGGHGGTIDRGADGAGRENTDGADGRNGSSSSGHIINPRTRDPARATDGATRSYLQASNNNATGKIETLIVLNGELHNGRGGDGGHGGAGGNGGRAGDAGYGDWRGVGGNGGTGGNGASGGNGGTGTGYINFAEITAGARLYNGRGGNGGNGGAGGKDGDGGQNASSRVNNSGNNGGSGGLGRAGGAGATGTGYITTVIVNGTLWNGMGGTGGRGGNGVGRITGEATINTGGIVHNGVNGTLGVNGTNGTAGARGTGTSGTKAGGAGAGTAGLASTT